MRKIDIFPHYRKCCDELSEKYNYMKSLFSGDYIDELCKIRGYVGQEQRSLLLDMDIGYCSIEDIEVLGGMRKELGLVSAKDSFILNDRFIIPVDDISGELVSLIGYFPDKKKIYNFTDSIFFKRVYVFQLQTSL